MGVTARDLEPVSSVLAGDALSGMPSRAVALHVTSPSAVSRMGVSWRSPWIKFSISLTACRPRRDTAAAYPSNSAEGLTPWLALASIRGLLGRGSSLTLRGASRVLLTGFGDGDSPLLLEGAPIELGVDRAIPGAAATEPPKVAVDMAWEPSEDITRVKRCSHRERYG